jgi:type I restriction enzyme S subunit
VWQEAAGKWVADSHVTIIRPTGNLLSEWLKFWLESPMGQRFVLDSKTGATKQTELSSSKLKDCSIPLPDIGVQRTIVGRIVECVARVDEIDQLRNECSEAQEFLIESLIEAQFRSIDGHPVRLSDVCSITSMLVDPRKVELQQLVHVGGANIESKTGRLVGLKTAAEEKLMSSKFVFDESMVLYNKIRPYLMKAARPSFKGLCSADMYPLSPKTNQITRDYLYYVLISQRFTDYAISGSNRAGMPKVNREHLFAYKFALPPLDVQERVTEKLDVAVAAALDLKTEMTSSGAETDSLRGAVLYKAFGGEL